MDKKANFNKAFNDLFGIGKEESDLDSSEPQEMDFTVESSVSAQDAASDDVSTNSRLVVDSSAAGSTVTAAPRASAMETSYLSADTQVEGTITSDGNLDLAGQLKGNVSVKGALKIEGKVEGDLSAHEVSLLGSRVQGNVHAIAGVLVDTDATLTGDIAAAELSCDGRIEGNLVVTNLVSLKQHSVILGNIKAGSLVVEQGVSIQGNLEITNPGK